jgi:hypothetical protein
MGRGTHLPKKQNCLLPEPDTFDSLIPKVPRNRRWRRPPSSDPREITVEHAHKVLLPPCDEADHDSPITHRSGNHRPHLPRRGGELPTSLQIHSRDIVFFSVITTSPSLCLNPPRDKYMYMYMKVSTRTLNLNFDAFWIHLSRGFRQGVCSFSL